MSPDEAVSHARRALQTPNANASNEAVATLAAAFVLSEHVVTLTDSIDDLTKRLGALAAV